MKIYKLLLLVACSAVGASLYAVAYRYHRYDIEHGFLRRWGPKVGKLNDELIIEAVLGCLVPLLLAIDLYQLSQTLVRGFRSGAVTLAGCDLIGVFTLLNLALFLYDDFTIPVSSWDIIRDIPGFMGPASLGVLAVYATAKAADTPALTLRSTAPYWIAIRFAQIAVRRFFD